MRLTIALAFLVLTAAGASAQTIDSIKILDFGIYTATQVRTRSEPGTSTGTVTEVQNLKLVTQTEVIKPRIGLRFGIEYMVVGQPKNRTVKLSWITRFPPQGMTNAKGEKFEENAFASSVKIGERTHRTFTFDHEWEIVPGEWAMEFYYEGRKIGEKRFVVLKPE